MTGTLSHRHRKWLGWLNLLARFASVQLESHLVGFALRQPRNPADLGRMCGSSPRRERKFGSGSV